MREEKNEKSFCFLLLSATIIALNGCGGLKNIEQTDLSLRKVRRPITTVVVHHTAGSFTNDIEKLSGWIDRNHHKRFRKMNKSEGKYIAYHFMVTPNGRVWKTRHPKHIGHHAGNWEVNKKSLAICLVGDFSNRRPSGNKCALWMH